MSKLKGGKTGAQSKASQDEDMEEDAPNGAFRLPDKQDPEDRRQIRYEYRNLSESIRGN